jgi:glycosyltransferase involved in cell wall biosynthesis
MIEAASAEAPLTQPKVEFDCVTVVMPALNAEATIEDQLAALAGQTYNGRWELVVSDNGSTDRTVEIARSWEPRLPALRIVDSSARRGVAYARNLAAETAGELIAFCDADDVVEPQWLAQLVVTAENGADIVCGSLDHEALNDAAISSARGGATTVLPTTYGFLPYAVGGNCAVRHRVIDRIGGWNPSYSRGEDVDFSWRAQLAGFSVDFAPEAVIHCRHRNSLPGLARQVFDYARAEVGLYHEYRGQGARRRTAGQVARSYLYVLTRLPFLVMSRRRRANWLVAAAGNLGRVAGSFQHKVFAP